MNYIPVIGLEIHAELLTNSKVYCSCSNKFGGDVNERVCPVCSAMPGTLPVINKNAVTQAIRAGLSLCCRINNYSSFDRKNYFYPDLPKAYQITQFEHPICSDGTVTINKKTFRINRIHIEEDAGKLTHDVLADISLTDYNRCGVPLIEIVTEPDFSCAKEVQDFVEAVALRLKYAGVCDAKLEQGSLRVDVNISIMPENSKTLGIRAEIKNLNSLKSIGRAIEYEIKRQSELLSSGKEVIQETRRFEENSGTTKSLRTKSDAHDYRYFPEPDIPPVIVSDSEINKIKASMPEMPDVRYEKYINVYKLPDDDAKLIISDKAFSDFYDETVKVINHYKEVSNIMLGEVNRNINETGIKITDVPFSPCDIADVIILINNGKISKNASKEIIKIMFERGEKPEKIAKDRNLLMEDNRDELIKIADEIISQNADNVASYRNGNEKLFGYFMGQMLRRAGKSANPQLVRDVLFEKLK